MRNNTDIDKEDCPKFRIEIHSEPIRNFPNYSVICIRTKQIHFDLIRRNFSIRGPFKINPTYNPKEPANPN